MVDSQVIAFTLAAAAVAKVMAKCENPLAEAA
jgi:hypothetical protein